MSARVPLKVYLDGDTFIRLERVASRRGVLMRDLVERAIVAGLAPGTVSGPTDRGRRTTAAERERIVAMHEAGCTPATIARTVGLSYHGVRYQLRKAGRL